MASLTSFQEGFTYDGVNRLNQANDSSPSCAPVSDYICWFQHFHYDQYGNMWAPNGEGGGLPTNGLTPQDSTWFNATNNQLVPSAGYDAAGNQTTLGSILIQYDAENRQILTSDGATVDNYAYDDEGRRVAKWPSNGPTTAYVYDVFGHLAAEYDPGATAPPACQTCYLTYDHLGSVRMVTDQRGDLISRHDYAPFGQEIYNAAGRSTPFGNSDGVSQRFTGKERDGDTTPNLDFFGARYYGAALGRFTSPDEPLVDQYEDNAQSWNLYSYGRNNPLRNIDPTGMSCVTLDNGSQADNGDGQGCSGAGVSAGNSNDPSTLNQGQVNAQVTAQQGSWFAAVGTNAFLSLSNAANSFFSFIAPDSQLLSQTPTGHGAAAQIGNGIGIAATFIGPGGEEAAAAKSIKVSWGRLLHVLALHTGGVANKSFFGDTAEVVSLIKAAESATAVPSVGGRFTRTLDAGRAIGTDITTGQPTSVYTVVTDSNGGLVTAFPGSPRR